MIVDKLTKKRYYIPYNTNDNNTTTKAIAKSLLNHIWKLFILFLSLILNGILCLF